MNDTTATTNKSHTATKACFRPLQVDDRPSTKDCGRSHVRHIASGESREHRLSVPILLPGTSSPAGDPAAPGALTCASKDDPLIFHVGPKRSLTREAYIKTICTQDVEKRFPKLVAMPQLHCISKALNKDFEDLSKMCVTTLVPSLKRPNQKTVESVNKMFNMCTINRAIFLRQLGILPKEDAEYIAGYTSLSDKISDHPYYISRAVLRPISQSTLPSTPGQPTDIRGRTKAARVSSPSPHPHDPAFLFLQPDLSIKPRKKHRQRSKLRGRSWSPSRPQPVILPDVVLHEPTHKAALRVPLSLQDAIIMADTSSKKQQPPP